MDTKHEYKIEDVRLAIIKRDMERLFRFLDKKPAFRDEALSFMVDKNKDADMINAVLAQYPALIVTDKIKKHMLKCGIEKRDENTISQLLTSSPPDFRIQIMYHLLVNNEDAWVSKFLEVYPEMAVAYLFDPNLMKSDTLYNVNGNYLIELIVNNKLWQSLQMFVKIMHDNPQLKFPKRDGRFCDQFLYTYSYDYSNRIPLHPMTKALLSAVEKNHSKAVRCLLEAGAEFPKKQVYKHPGAKMKDLVEIALNNKNETIIRDLFFFGFPRNQALESYETYQKGWSLCMAMQERQEKYLAFVTVMKACAYGRAPFSFLSVEMIFHIFENVYPFDYKPTAESISNQLVTFKTESYFKRINAIAWDPARLLCNIGPFLDNLSAIKKENIRLSEMQNKMNGVISAFLLTLPVDNLMASKEVSMLDKYRLLNNDHVKIIRRRQNWLATLFELSNSDASNEIVPPEIYSFKGKISLDVSLLMQIKIMHKNIEESLNEKDKVSPDEINKMISQFLCKLLIQENTWESKFFWSLWTDNLDKDLIYAAISLIPDLMLRDACLLAGLRGLSADNKGHLYDVCQVKRWRPGMFMDSVVKKMENDHMQIQISLSKLQESVLEDYPEDSEEERKSNNTNK